MAKLYPPITAAVRQATRNLNIAKWDSSQRFEHWKSAPNDHKQRIRKQSETRPLGSLFLFPSVDPYTSLQRAEFRAVMENISWVNRANKLMVRVTVGGGFTTEIKPRSDQDELDDEKLNAWQSDEKNKLAIPWADGEEWTPHEIDKFIDKLGMELDLDVNIAKSTLYMREQGQSGIMMLPELRDEETGFWMMPQTIRVIRPEHVVKIWLDMNTGEMSSLQVIGITSNGGKIDTERLIWMTSDFNVELHSDFYGESKVLPVLDTAKTMGILYAQDYQQAAQYTWHQPKVFKVEIPPRDYKRVNTVLTDFLRKNNNSQGRDIAVTQSVELLSSNTNTGDLSGLINLDNQLIDQVAGFYNIPPFLLSKGKAGNLGGNAQKEEVDGFLNFEVRPQQEIIETQLEKQWFDRILMVLFQVESPDQLPVKIECNFLKPDIETLFNKEQYEVMLDMVSKNIISEDGMIQRLGVDNLRDGLPSGGADVNPRRNTWPRRRHNPNWEISGSKWRRKGWSKRDMQPAWNERPTINISTDQRSWPSQAI